MLVHASPCRWQGVGKPCGTPRGTFPPIIVPPPVLQHVARHVLGPFRSLSRAGSRGEGKGEGDQGFSCVRCRALLFAISDHWSPIGDNMGRFCAQAVTWGPACVGWLLKSGLCRLLGRPFDRLRDQPLAPALRQAQGPAERPPAGRPFDRLRDRPIAPALRQAQGPAVALVRR